MKLIKNKISIRYLILLASNRRFFQPETLVGRPTSTLRRCECSPQILVSDLTTGEILFLFTADTPIRTVKTRYRCKIRRESDSTDRSPEAEHPHGFGSCAASAEAGNPRRTNMPGHGTHRHAMEQHSATPPRPVGPASLGEHFFRKNYHGRRPLLDTTAVTDWLAYTAGYVECTAARPLPLRSRGQQNFTPSAALDAQSKQARPPAEASRRGSRLQCARSSSAHGPGPCPNLRSCSTSSQRHNVI